MRNSDMPPFHRLDWQEFERFTVELLRVQDGVVSSRLHGVHGQKDYGVDVVADRSDGSAELVSCKCYETADPKMLAAWCTEFLSQYERRWSTWIIHRFVLVVAVTNLERTQNAEQLREERARFAKMGIAFEIWGPGELKHRLRQHRSLASDYLGDAWADRIWRSVAPLQPSVPDKPNLLSDAVVSQLAELQTLLSGEAAKRVEAANDELRAGNHGAVVSLLGEYREPVKWSQLNRSARAAIARLEGAYALQVGDIDRAAQLDDEASALEPSEPRLAARIALELAGVDAALDKLGVPSTFLGRQLKASLLLGGDMEDRASPLLDALLQEKPDDAETLRLISLHRLAGNQRFEALEGIRKAEARAGHWIAMMRAGVAIRYSMALSPVVTDPQFLLAPNPINPELVREDRLSQGYLLEAWNILEVIQAKRLTNDQDDIWQLAVLCNSQGRRDEAINLARSLLQAQPGEPSVIGWAIQRDLDIDWDASRSALTARYRDGGSIADVRALGLLLVTRKQPNGVELLRSSLEVQSGEAAAEASRWIAYLEERPQDEASRAWQSAQVDDDWSAAGEMLEAMLLEEPPNPFGLSAAEYAASAGRWDVLQPHLDALLRYKTSTAARVAVFVARSLHDYRRVLEILQQEIECFGGSLPEDLRRIKAEAMAATGAANSALREAVMLAAATGDVKDQLFLAELRASVGSVRDAGPILRKALAEEMLGGDQALSWAQRVRPTDPELSKVLLHRAVDAGIAPQLMVGALHEARELGLDILVQRLAPDLRSLAHHGVGNLRLIGSEQKDAIEAAHKADFEQTNSAYQLGGIPIHLMAARAPGLFMRVHQANAIAKGRPDEILRGRLVRNGARPRNLDYDLPFGEWRLHLDITALLEAHRFGLLDKIEQHPNGITVAWHLPKLLQEISVDLSPGSPLLRAAQGKILELADKGILSICFVPGALSQMVTAPDPKGTFGVRDLAQALKTKGLISEDAAAAFLEGAAAAPLSDEKLELDVPFAVATECLVRLAKLDVLERVARFTGLRVSYAQKRHLEDAVTEYDRNVTLARVAEELGERIARGLEVDTYRLTPFIDLHADMEDASLAELALADLLSVGPVAGGTLWFDDRNVTGYANSESLLIVGIIEVVQAMAKAGLLTDREEAHVMSDLRASGAIGLPFEVAEILLPLLDAPIVDGRLHETPELATIRRAFATTTGFDPFLKMGQGEGLLEDRPDEDQTVKSTMRMLSDTLADLWLVEGMPLGQLFSRSDWLWQNVSYFRPTRPVPGDDPGAALEQFVAMQIGHCLDKATDVGGWNDERAQLRQEYLHWCWERLVVPRLPLNPKLIDQIGRYMTFFYRGLLGQNFVAQAKSKSARERDSLMQERLIFKRVDRLPDPVREIVLRSGIFKRMVRVQSRMTFEAVHFDPAKVWKAIEKAVRVGSAQVRSLDGAVALIERRDGDLHFSGAVDARLGRDTPALAAVDRRNWTKLIEAFAREYDITEQAKAMLSKAGKSEPHRLASLIHDAQSQSVIGRQRIIEASLRNFRGVELALLAPPTISDQARHLRVDLQSTDLSDCLSRAAVDLSETFDVREAVRRLGGLAHPVIANSFKQLDEGMLALIEGEAATPFGLVSAIKARQALLGAETNIADLLERLVSSVQRWSGAFIDMIEWTATRFSADPAWPTFSPAVRWALTWSHADWIIGAFAKAGLAPEIIEGNVDLEPFDGGVFELLARQAARPVDQADPARLDSSVLLYHALGLALEGSDPSAVTIEVRQKINEILQHDYGGSVAFTPAIVLRRPEGPDSSNGVLSAQPAGLYDDDAVGLRDRLIDLALDRLEIDPWAADLWHDVAAYISQGLNTDQYARLAEIGRSVSVYDLAFSGGEEPRLYLWRAAIAPHAWMNEGRIAERLIALTAECAARLGDPTITGTIAERAFGELVQIASLVGAWKPDQFDDSITLDLLAAVADHWPACLPTMRLIAHDYTSRAPATFKSGFWDLDVLLRRRG